MRDCVTRVQDFVNVCWDCYRVGHIVVYTALKIMNTSRQNEYNSVHTGPYKVTYHVTVFEKVTPVYKKKSPGQPERARVTRQVTFQLSQFRDSLHPFTVNESLAYKHKNNVINSNMALRVTAVDMTHFAAVCATRAHA